jgi:hypothetical protein
VSARCPPGRTPSPFYLFIENFIHSFAKTLDVTIFYPFPDGVKMTKFDKTLGYNIVTLYEKREGNTGRAMDQQKE